MKILIITLLFTLVSFAKECVYESSKADFEVSWIAFKTPSKVGVGGMFKELGLTKKSYSASSIKELLVGTSFKINTRSTWTRNTSRDAKLVKYFFTNHVGGYLISGSVKKMSKGKLTLELKMNGVTKEVPMTFKEDKSFFKAKGVIDILDFNLSNQLNAINKACETLHQGKTWSDVEIELKVNFDKECK